MTHDHARTYGGWRRSRSIGLLGLGPAATFILLGGFAALVVIAAVSLKALLYAGPPAALAATAGLVLALAAARVDLAERRSGSASRNRSRSYAACVNRAYLRQCRIMPQSP